MMKYILFILIISFLCGCSTIASIKNDPGYANEAKVYAGTRNDLSGLPYIFSDEPFWFFLAAGELPFCLVADTVLLPYTIYLDSQHEKKEANYIGIESLSNDEMVHFKEHFFVAEKTPTILDETEGAIILSKLKGSLITEFSDASFENPILYVVDNNGFCFYRTNANHDKYLWIHFGNDGHFQGAGKGNEPPFKP